MIVTKSAPDGIFPPLNDLGVEEETCSVHQLPKKLLEEIPPFIRAQKEDYGAFLRTVWSIVLRQYIGSDHVCFGQWKIKKHEFEATVNGLGEDQIEGGVFEVDIPPNETVEEFGKRSQLSTCIDDATSAFIYNTAVIIGEEIGQSDAVTIFNKVEMYQRVNSSKCNLLLVLEQGFGSPEALSIISKTSILSTEQAQHVASTVSQAISEISMSPTQLVKNLNLVGQQDRNLLIRWNDIFCEHLHTPILVESIRKHSVSRPEAVALCSWDGQLTFGELEAHASSLALFLSRIGVGSTTLVPIIFEKSLWMTVCQLAVLKTGAALMLLEPSDPDERLRRIVRKSEATVILSSEMYAHRAAPWTPVSISVSRSFLTSLPPANPSSQLPPTDYSAPAYVIFTSGSTSEPKGVTISHKAMAQLGLQAAYQRVDSTSRILQFAAYSFTMAIVETYMSLAVGATLCIPSDHDRINRLPEVMEEMKISWAIFTPSLLRSLDANRPPSSLKTVSMGGEPLGNREFQSWFGKVNLLNGYGMSENTGFTSLSPLTRLESDLKAFPPSPTTRKWLVDPTDHNRLVPIGVVGELLIEGPGLANGYFGDPDATAQAFIESPLWRMSMSGSIGNCKRMYKTGDLFQFTQRGEMKYIGRKGTKVKIRGKRVDLGEVEAHLRQSCPEGIRVVAEAAIPAGEETTVLAAFLSLAGDSNGTSADRPSLVGGSSTRFRAEVNMIRDKIRASLPEHMQPALYIPLGYIPMTFTGKLARRLLREIIQQRTRADLESYQSAAVALIPPSSAGEKHLHGLFAQVLELDPSSFGIDHDFIRLGGDSLAAMRLINIMPPTADSLTVAHVLEHRTIANLARLISDLSKDSDFAGHPSHKLHILGEHEEWDNESASPSLKEAILASGVLDTADVQQIYPCSSIQEGLLLSHMRNPQLYQTRVTWEISTESEGELPSVDQVQIAWHMVCVRHPMLRTIFLESPIAGHLALQAVLKPTSRAVATATYLTGRVTPPTHTQPLRQSHTGMSWLPKLQIFQSPEERFYCTLDIHHALMDAASMYIIESDLRKSYKLAAQNPRGPDHLLPTRSSYADYVRLLSTTNPDNHLKFWKSELQGIKPCMFPQLGGHEESAPRLCSTNVDVGLSNMEPIDSFCREIGVTVANVFKLAWALVLNSFTGSSSVCFGYMTAGRDLPLEDIESIVGPFIRPLPCCLHLDQHKNSIEAVESLQASFIRALPYQQISLAEIHHTLGLAGQGLFNTAITFLPRNDRHLQPSSIALRQIALEGPTEYDLVVEVEPVPTGFECRFKYWSNVMSAQTASRVAGLMGTAIGNIINNPQVGFNEMDLLSEQDRRQLNQWNGKTPTASNTLLHDLIQQTCLSRPDDFAIDAWDGALTYRQLDWLSSVLAAELQNRGIGPDIFVPICLDRCRWTPVAVLGVIKAGGAFCLLDPSYPSSRLSEICQGVAAPMILVGEGNPERGAELHLPSLIVGNALWETKRPRELLPNNVTPRHALYAVFTSGSTGKPKGVVLEHRSFCSTALMCLEPLDLRPHDRTLHFASYAFDVSVIEVIVPLVVGACICVPSEEDRLNRLSRVIRDYRVSWAFVTPTVARLLQPQEFPELRTLVLGGEAVLVSDVDTWSPWTKLISAYSPAECTPVGLSTTVNRASPNRLGWAFPSLAPWIVDPRDYQKLAPIGAVGELVIEGPVVGRGYLHDPAGSLPKSPFVAAPGWLRDFRPEVPYPQLYRTGDLVQYDDDGAICFVGRKDTQVKVRGQRLEPGEVEYNVRVQLPWAKTVIVEPVILSDQSTDAVVVAFISEAEPDPVQGHGMVPTLGLRDARFFTQVADAAVKLRNHLPNWMVPTIFLPLLQIPLTKSGKIDRKQLKELVVSIPRDELEGIETGPRDEPTTDMEKQLQALFAKVLYVPLEKIWANSDFFMLGGDSVGAMRLVSVGLEKGIDLSVAKIFEHSTLRNLAANVSPKDIGVQSGGPVPFSLLPTTKKEKILQLVASQCDLSEQDIDDIYPCTPLQEGLLAATTKKPGMYTAHFVYDLLDGVDLGRLQQAWEATVHNNAILRTRIVEALPYGAFQVVINGSHRRIDWPCYNSTKAYEEITANAPMGLGSQLLRFGIIDTPGDRQAIAVTLHHAIYDGISLHILLKQVDAAYQGLTPEVRQFNLLVKYLEELDPSVSDEFWRAQFAGLETSVFPALPSNVTSPKATELLEQEAFIVPVWSQSGITIANFIRLAWALVASYYIDSKDVVFGATVTGRALPIHGIQDISGPTIATLPFPVHIDDSQSVQEALSVVQSQATHMVPFEHTGLQNICRVSQEAAAACEFQSQLVVESPEAADSVSQTMVPRDRSAISAAFSSYAIVVICTPSHTGDRVRIAAQFDPEVMNTEATSRLLSQFAHVLGQLCSRPHQRIRDVQVNSPSDIKLLRKWNQVLPEPYRHTLHGLVLDCAVACASHLAIDSWDGQLTYRQLDHESARVSQQIMSAGVRLGDRVALSFPRSKWSAVAILGVLRAGAACVSIDPALPSGRIRQILDISRPSLFLTSADSPVSVKHLASVPSLLIPSDVNVPGQQPWPVTKPEDVGFIIFTSGSTGVPKGIVIEHVNIASSIYYSSETMGAHPAMRALHFASYAFDAILTEIFTTWLQGGCVCIPSETDRLSNLAGFIEKYHVNWALMTPSALSALQPRDVPSLQTLIVGGEPVPTDLVYLWGSALRLISAYGPAETSIYCNGGPLVPGLSSNGHLGHMLGSVGWVTVPGDPERLAPLGAVGELLIEGPLVTRGYLHGPEKTSSAFIETPKWLRTWRSGNPSRIFWSGDLVQYEPDGQLRYVGRKDAQVKLRGQRLELAEVENHLRSAVPTAHIVVADVIRRGPNSSKHDLLLGFLHFAREKSPGKTDHPFQEKDSMSVHEALTGRRHLEEALPSYMVPAILVSLAYVPYTSSGKVDRRALRQAAENLTPLQLQSFDLVSCLEAKQLPQTGGENIWQQLWSQVLSVEPEAIYRDGHFLRMGGDSVAAMKLSSLARRKGLEITVAEIFNHPVLKDMAVTARSSTDCGEGGPQPFSLVSKDTVLDALVESTSRVCEVSTGQIMDIYPCTPIQAGLMALTSQQPNAYVALYKYVLPRDIDVDRLRAAWNLTADVHPILRTRIVQMSTGETYQAVIDAPLNWRRLERGVSKSKQLQYTARMGAPLLHLIYAPSPCPSEPPMLYVSIHHALYDGWSWPLLLQEVDRAYKGLRLHPNPFNSFVGYVHGSMKDAAGFWEVHLRNADPAFYPVLPSANYVPRPSCEDSLVTKLPPFTGSGDVTLATKLKLAWALLTWSYRNKSDVVFGVSSSGRGLPVAGIEQIIGPTIATTPLRIQIDREMKVHDALYDVQRASLEQSSYEHLGLQNIRQQGDGAQAACRFQTLLVIQPEGSEPETSWFQSQDTLSDLRQFSTYALTLACEPVSDCLRLSAVFDPYVISSGQVQRVFQLLSHILGQLSCASEDTKIKKLDMLTGLDWYDLQRINPELPPQVDHVCAHEGIQETSFQQGAKVAVDAWDGQLTYNQLDLYATQLARDLASLGVQPDTFVALYFHKSVWTVVAQLAVLKSGGAFAMLDTSHPPQRLRSICQTIKPVCILASDGEEVKIGFDAPIVPVDEKRFSQHLCQDHFQFKTMTSPTHAMYAIATSGTTGTPKIVVIEHGSFMVNARSMIERLSLDNTSRVIQFTGYSFDTMIVDHIVTLLVGGCICIPSPSDRDNQLAKIMAEMRVNWAMLTTSVIQMLSPELVPTLRTLVQAGEPMTQRIVDCWACHVRLINAYGPAECSILSCISDSLSPTSVPNNIGPGSACSCWITDPDDVEQLVPIGAEGELVIEGPILSRGYLSDRDRTAAAFVAQPEWLNAIRGGQQANGRIYRTGDIVKYGPDNTILYLGRKDHQVKLRGQRIELAEVEHHVRGSFPNAIQAVVDVTRLADNDAESLIAFILSSQSRQTSDGIVNAVTAEFTNDVRSAELRLQECLPPYMVPSVFLPVSRIPWNVNGKVDRGLLRRLASSFSQGEFNKFNSSQHSAPRTHLEKRLHAIWARVLNLSPESFGTEDSFFRIGGDSITSMQVASQCQSDSIAVTVKEIFQHRTIAKLASHAKQSSPAVQRKLTLYDENSKETSAPLSPIQQLFFEHAPQGHNHFNQSFFLRINEDLASETIGDAMTIVVETHSIFNARFEQLSDGSWVQQMSDDQQGYRYQSHLVATRQDMETICGASQRSLDVQHGPLCVVDHFTVSGTQEQYLFLVAHHLIIDLVSWRIILADLEDLLRFDKSPSPPPIDFMQWCHLRAEHSAQISAKKPAFCKDTAAQEVSDFHRDYWGDFLPNNYGDADVYSVTIDEHSSNLILGDANKPFRTQPVELIQAAILHAFAQVFDDRPIPIIFTEGHGRQAWDDAIDLTRTVGWFTNIWPILMSLDSADSIADAVKRTKDTRRQAQEESAAYLSSCNSHSGAVEPIKGRGSMEILFNYLGHYQQLERPDALFTIDGSLPIAANIAHDMPRFALLDVSAFVQNGRLELQFFVNRNMKHQNKLRRWVHQCEQSLHNIATQMSKASSGYTLSDFPLISFASDAMDKFTTEILPRCAGEVQDIYPCSPIQQGMLISRARNNGLYKETFKWKVVPSNAHKTVSIEQLVRAWQQVVDRHDALRTSFVSISDGSYQDQLVMANVKATVSVHTSLESPPLSMNKLEASPLIRPPHRLDIVQSEDSAAIIELHIDHALVDGTSVEILKQDFTLAYDSQLASSAPSYRDYIEYLQKDGSHQAAHQHWSCFLRGATPCLFPSLIDSGPVTVADDNKSDFDSIFIDLMPANSFERFCETFTLSLTSVIHVAWAIVINRFTAMDNICFGYLTTGRHIPVPGIQSMVGPLINMLVGRVHLQPNTSLLSILQQCHEDCLESLEHQHLSLAEILHSMELPAGDAFNTAVSIQRHGLDHGRHHSSIALENLGGTDRSEYPILLNVGITDERASLTLTYQSSFVGPEEAASIARTFRQVLAEVMRNPAHLTIHDVEALKETDKRHLPDQHRNPPELIHDLAPFAIHAMCLKQPHLPAVVAWDGQFTYEELDRLSSALAEELINCGAQQEQPIPLYFDKSCWTAVAMLATWKAGAPFVLLDPSHPAARHRMICEEVNASLILSSESNSSKASCLVPQVIHVGGSLFDRACGEARGPLVQVNRSNMAYVVFTSGSTGQPKGVVIEHGSLAISAATLSPRMQIDSASRVLQFAAYAWDVSILETVFPLLAGGCVCIPSAEDRMYQLPAAANDLEVNWAMLTPTVSRTLRPDEFQHLKTLMLAGEPVSPRDILDWHESVHLLQTYGVTECTILNTVSNFLTPSSNMRNIGWPTGCVTWIVDRNDPSRLLPYGGTGELVIEGPQVGRGYLNQPELSKAIFIDPPAWLLSLRKGVPTRLYKTGDLARHAADGSVILLGRKDSQVKLRGQRIELGEVEHHVRAAFPSALQVIVEIVSRAGDDNAQELVAFIHQSTPGEPSDSLLYPASEAFRQATTVAVSTLQESAPVFMTPTSFFPLTHVPKASTGKVDRAKLRQYITSLPSSAREAYSVTVASRRTPKTPMEARLQQHVAQVLQTAPNKIPLEHNLFQVGLDSIQVIRLVGNARNDGLDLSVRTFFQHPRLVELAPLVTETRQVQAPPSRQLVDAPVVDIDALCRLWNLDCRRVSQVLPTTYFQRQFLEGEQADYIAVHFSGHIDRSRLRAATEAAMKKHSILRSVFVPFDNTIMQVVLSNVAVPFEEIPIDQDPKSVAETICRKDSQTSIAFGHMHFKLIVLASANTMTVILRFHHAQYDGFCLPYVFEDIASAYEGLAPRVETDFAEYLSQRLFHGRSLPELQFWRDILRGSSMTYLGTTSPDLLKRPASSQTIDSRCEVCLPPINQGGITMATVAKGAWALCLAQESRSHDLVFGQVVSGRTLPLAGIERIVGPCVNIIPVRVALQPQWTGHDLLEFVQDQNTLTMTHDTVDLDTMVAKSTDWPTDTRWGSVVQYQNIPAAGEYPFIRDVDHSIEGYQFNPPRGYPHLSCQPDSNGITKIQLLAPRDIMTQDDADRVVATFRDLAMHLLTHPDQPLGELVFS